MANDPTVNLKIEINHIISLMMEEPKFTNKWKEKKNEEDELVVQDCYFHSIVVFLDYKKCGGVEGAKPILYEKYADIREIMEFHLELRLLEWFIISCWKVLCKGLLGLVLQSTFFILSL